jgi:hypothetical protein
MLINLIYITSNLLLFDLTVRYGLEPGRALLILFGLIFFFTSLYVCFLLGTVKDISLADSTGNLNSTEKRVQPYNPEKRVQVYNLFNKVKQDGIWQVWPADRLRKKEIGSDEPRLMVFKDCRVLRYGFYFSLLSAFNIGWRNFNIGDWIARLQCHPYTLQATGWARRIAGLQSLISLYLLVISVLSYFGQLFE